MALKILKYPFESPLSLPAVPASYIKCNWSEDTFQTKKFSAPVPFSASPVLDAEIVSSRILSSGDDLKTRFEITFRKDQDHEVNFSPGDTVGILPINTQAEVDSLIKLMGLDDLKNTVCNISVSNEGKKRTLPGYIPPQTSAAELLTKYLHIRFPPKKLMLRALSFFTTDEQEKRRLDELASRECSEEYSELFVAQGLTITDVLEAFVTCHPPLNVLIEHLPRLQPRPYSIASSPLTDENSFRIVLSLVESKFGHGICSGYLFRLTERMLSAENSDLSDDLSSLNLNVENSAITSTSCQKVSLYFRVPNQFRLPDDQSIHLILIGPGTGLAPFLGFLEHKRMLKQDAKGKSKCWLFFGCRNERDYIYRKDIEQYLQEGVLTKLFVSFSRSIDPSRPKYVQDNIILIKDQFIKFLLEEKTLLFICGDAKNMITDVMKTIKSCLSEVNGLDINEANVFVNDLQKKGKIITDCWI